MTSRSIGYAIGLGFCALAFIPPTAVALAAMPLPVMGAALFFTAAFVFTSGLQMITARMLDARKTLVIGFSFAMAFVADLYHEALMGVPIVLQPIFGNSLVLGTVCAVVLNLIMRIGVRQRVSIKLAPGVSIAKPWNSSCRSKVGAGQRGATSSAGRSSAWSRYSKWWVIRLAASRSRQASMNSTSMCESAMSARR